MRTSGRRHAFVATLLAAATPAARAENLEERLKSKLDQAFVGNADWALDYEAALTRAKKEGKLVFAYFTRSYFP